MAGDDNNVGADKGKNKKEVMEQRFLRLEASITKLNGWVEGITSKIEGSEGRLESLESEESSLRDGAMGQLEEFKTSLRRDIVQLIEDEVSRLVNARLGGVLQRVQAIDDKINERVDGLREEVVVCRAAVAGGAMNRDGSRVRVPDPPKFGGKRDAKEIDTFLWSVERYFDASFISEDAPKITTATMYLSGDAILWWRRREADVKRGTCQIGTWEEFKADFKKQFYPDNAGELALKKLRALKHTGTIREYVNEFTTLLFEIEDMTENMKLFYFMDGLQRWAEQELKRRNVRDLADAISVAESLYEIRGESKKDRFIKKGGSKEKGGGVTSHQSSSSSGSKFSKDKGKSKEKSSSSEKKKMDCFLCGGPHWVRECPQKQKLNAMVSAMESNAESDDGTRMGSLRLLNKISKEKPTSEGNKLNILPRSSGLIFVESIVNGVRAKSLFDCGATHNFVTKNEAARLGLKYQKESGSLKAVNSSSMPIHGVARNVPLRLGEWEGKADFTVVTMDDFNVVLGLEFMDTVRPIILEKDGSLTINGQRNARSVQTIREAVEGKALSALQVKKGLRRSEATYLAVMVEEPLSSVIDVPKEVKQVLMKYQDVMPPELPRRLPPRREVDHEIELEPGAKPPAMGPYRMAPPELEELRRQLKDLLDGGLIRPSKAPYGAPVLFQKKHDGSLRMCIDYRALNKVTVKNKYPIPLVADLFDRLGKGRYFSKLDLRSGYWQVRIKEGDEQKTTCVTRYGAYEFLVMPFGLTNAPATFCTLMNKILYPFLDKFVVVYLDDIVIYSDSLQDHIQHLEQVFQVLRDNELYVKPEKCSFAQAEVSFLGHRVRGGVIMMEHDKVKAINEWEIPKNVSELRSFLGLANYYRRFIAGYSAKTAPLTELLKKKIPWKWDDRCQQAFEGLKGAVTKEPVLALPDYSKAFEVHTDASDFAIGGVLIQEGHPVAFESRKLNETERRYPVHDKEMTAIIHCLRIWRHYLLGSKFVVKTDNVATTYFQNQKKISPKQARWQDFLAEFDYVMEYKPGRINIVADALSRKAMFANISGVTVDVAQRVKEGLDKDHLANNLMTMAKEGKTRRFWVEDDVLYTVGRRMYVPKWNNLRREVMKECHDSMWAGHPGIQRTIALVEQAFYWPHMQDDIEAYVKTCLVCQQDKIEQRVPAGLLQPLPIPEKPWESISMDFISALPKSDGSGSILVVVDRLSKYGTFIPAPKDCTGEEAARLLFKNVVKYWGLPKSIISDRDPRFTARFWTELFKLMGSSLHFSTSFHPQTDGQTERVNALLELYLRHFVSANQRDWAKLMDVAQFSYNLQRSEATNQSPFEIVLGQQPLTPQAMVNGYSGQSPAAFRMAQGWHEQLDIAKAYLEKASKKMKKYADKHRRDLEFQVGDMVMVKLLPQQYKVFRQVHKGLVRRYEGPFPITKKVGRVSYRVELPSKMKIHPVFHVSMLKPYQGDTDDPSRGVSNRAPPTVITSFEKEVDEILADRVVRKRGVPRCREFLIKWRGLPDSEASWEKQDDLWQFQDKIEAFDRGTGASQQ